MTTTTASNTITHSVTLNGRALIVYLYPSRIEGTEINAVICSHEINQKTGKPMCRRGRQQIGAYDTHAKALREWLYASRK